MTTNNWTDPILEQLGGLPPAAPNAAVVERIRRRAYARLDARRNPPMTARRTPAAMLGDAALFLVGVGYLVVAVGEAIKVQAFLP